MKTVRFLYVRFCVAAWFVAVTAGLAQTPVYQYTRYDPTWTHIGGGVYTMSASAEYYPWEVWERPLEDGKWTTNAVTYTTTGKYYAYADLQEGSFGYDSTWLYVKFVSAGAFIHEVGKSPEAHLLNARYNFYFQATGVATNRFLLNVPDGSAISTGGFSPVGKVYQDANGNVLGSGLTVTYDSSGGAEKNLTDGFEKEILPGELVGRRSGTTVELALRYTGLGLTSSSFNSLPFAYIGLAVSNPSSNNDIFANDEFPFAAGFGVEYDTLIVPEPSAAILFLCGTTGLLVRRRRFGSAPHPPA
jgi:hypothetical protein